METYDPQAVTRPLPTPYQSAEVSPDTYGAAIGEGVQQLGGAAAQIARHAKANADAAAVLGAIGESKAALNDVILDPEKGYASQKGEDAIANRAGFLKKFNDAVEKAGTALTNEDQQRAFQQHSLYIREEAARHVLSHESAQIEDVARAKYQGAGDQTLRTMHSVIDDPAELDKQLADLKRLATVESVRRYGRDPGAIQAVVGPEMQKGALEAMNAAMATENPALVTSTFKQVSQYLGQHEHTYQRFASAIATKAQVNAESSAIIGGAVQAVAMPDGTIIPRLDSTKLASAIAALKPETPNLAEIQKVAEQREQVLAKVWNQSVATVVQRIQSAGTDPATGEFSLSSSGVSAPDRAWLQQNAPKALIDLRALDARAQKVDDREARRVSAENYSQALTALYDPAQKDTLKAMTMEQFQRMLLDEGQFPGGFTPQDRSKLTKQFGTLQKTQFDEAVGKTVKEQLLVPLPGPGNAARRDKLYGTLFDSTQDFIKSWEQQNGGKPPSTKDIRDHVDHELVKVKVEGTGLVFNDRVYRVEAEANPTYSGKKLTPTSDDKPEPAPVRAAAVKGRVTVRNAKGKAFTIPADQVDAFLGSDQGKGFTR